MISMDLKQQILHYYRVEERSLREIARLTKTDRKTVSRLVHDFEAAIKKDPDLGMTEFLATVPKYTKRTYTPRTMKGAVVREIDKCLKENEKRRATGMRKQCMKREDIHRVLLEKGYVVSYSSVCKYIARKKAERVQKTKDVFLRIHREPGVECEFDWGEVKLRVGGKQEALTMAVFAFPYSKGRRAYLFHRQDTLAYMESHRNFFKDIHGVPQLMVYDNMKVAVVFDDKEKKPTEALKRLSTFYKFQWRFCNARAGWEKGNVERSVDYIRGRAFTTRVDFATMEEAQKWLDMICDQVNAEPAALPPPINMVNCRRSLTPSCLILASLDASNWLNIRWISNQRSQSRTITTPFRTLWSVRMSSSSCTARRSLSMIATTGRSPSMSGAGTTANGRWISFIISTP